MSNRGRQAAVVGMELWSKERPSGQDTASIKEAPVNNLLQVLLAALPSGFTQVWWPFPPGKSREAPGMGQREYRAMGEAGAGESAPGTHRAYRWRSVGQRWKTEWAQLRRLRWDVGHVTGEPRGMR